ncbi:MAG: type III glutamate--ammonia ligase [Terriglobia bacterium]
MNDETKRRTDAQGIEFFLSSFVELSGAPKAKLVPATHVEDLKREGAGFAGFAAGKLNQGPHDPDVVSMPDFKSLTILPWRKNVAWVAGNLHVSGRPWPYCPRTILARQLERLRQKGYILNAGVEAEFMLLKKTEDARYVPWDSLDSLGKPCYDLRALYRNLDVMTTLIRHMQDLGWSPYANDHEDANCQFEINWLYSDAMTTSDRHTFFKWMVHTVAEQHGLWATFMPKPFSHLTGNGAHYHLSLADAENGQNLFLDENAKHGLSQLGRWFMGGILHHAAGLSAITAPLVNSYKRLAAGAPRSGATWAPVYITYGPANRTQMIRIPGPGRIEDRAIDGAANPYLACAVLLAAGMDGVENKIDPGASNTSNLYEVPKEELARRGIQMLPTTLREAVECFERDPVIKEGLGTEFASYYAAVKAEEWREYHQSVSEWETARYLASF